MASANRAMESQQGHPGVRGSNGGQSGQGRQAHQGGQPNQSIQTSIPDLGVQTFVDEYPVGAACAALALGMVTGAVLVACFTSPSQSSSDYYSGYLPQSWNSANARQWMNSMRQHLPSMS